MDKRTRYYRDVRLLIGCIVALLLGALLNEYKTYRQKPTWADTQIHFMSTAFASPLASDDLSSRIIMPKTDKVGAVWTETKTVVVPTTAQIIEKYSLRYKVPQALVHCIIKAESGYNPKAKNAHSTASGIAQFIDSTWVANRNRMGENPDLDLRFNEEEAIKTMVWMLAKGQKHQWEVYTLGHCNL